MLTEIGSAISRIMKKHTNNNTGDMVIVLLS